MAAFGSHVTLALILLGAQREAGSRDLWLDAKSRKVQKERSELARVARAALPSVVSITALEPSPKKDILSDGLIGPRKALGAGFFIHPDGYILTSYHVVEDGGKIQISLNSNEDSPTYEARVIGKDELTDVALLKIDSPRKFPVLALGSTRSVEVADWVVVIGNPFGMFNSVTVGVVSFKGRAGIMPNGKEGYFDFLQTDASINPGNSGGPVLDLHGNVIAIASAVNVSAQGIGFAVPIEIAKAVLPQLASQGSVRHSWMGISVRDASEALDAEPVDGVVVWDVLEGGPASEAGMKVGDVIVRVGTTQIRRAGALRWKVAMEESGKLMDLTVRRGGKPVQLRVRLAEAPPEADDDDVADAADLLDSKEAATNAPLIEPERVEPFTRGLGISP